MNELEKRKSLVKEALASIVRHHSVGAEAHKTMLDNCEKDSPEADFHKTMCESHLATGEKCARAAMSFKTDSDAMGKAFDALEPSNISGVAPAPPGVRMVPRAGAPAQSDRAPVPLQFEKMVSVEDE
jgi:hypothetical protein